MTLKKLIIISIVLFFILNSNFIAAAENKKEKPTRCSPVFPSDKLIEWDCVKIKFKKGETIENVLGENWESMLRFNRIDRRHIWQGKYLKIPYDKNRLTNFSPLPKTLEKAKDYHKYVFINLEEQFLGAYEYGELKFSFPVATGRKSHSTPKGIFRVLGFDKNHRSSLYKIEKTNIPYPMNWAVKFFVSKKGVDFWIHGRDLPGRPASHGCVGLYDEEMQKKYYKFPQEPKLKDAEKFYLWLFPEGKDVNRQIVYPTEAPTIPIEID